MLVPGVLGMNRLFGRLRVCPGDDNNDNENNTDVDNINVEFVNANGHDNNVEEGGNSGKGFAAWRGVSGPCRDGGTWKEEDSSTRGCQEAFDEERKRRTMGGQV